MAASDPLRTLKPIRLRSAARSFQDELEHFIGLLISCRDKGLARALLDGCEYPRTNPARKPPDDLEEPSDNLDFRTVVGQPRSAGEKVTPVSSCAADDATATGYVEKYHHVRAGEYGRRNPLDDPTRVRD
jgi:hypothetical protein